jgi:ribose transport system permease protein
MENLKSEETDIKTKLVRYLSSTEVNRALMLIAIFVFTYVMNPFFFTPVNLDLILKWGAIYSIAVMGVMLYFLVGGMDLSCGGVICLSNVLAAILMKQGFGVWLSVLIVIIIGALIGLSTATFSNFFSPPFIFSLPVFIYTLMLHFVLTGLPKVLTGAFPVYGLPSSYGLISTLSVGIIPITLIYMFIIFTIISFLLYCRPIGRHIYATGLNDDVARKMGVNVNKVRYLAFAVGSALQAFTGILMGSVMAEGSHLIGPGELLPILAGAFIGGISLSGGEGSPIGAILGGIMIYSIENIIVTLNISPFWKDVVTGIILIVFVTYDFVRRKRARAS